MTASSAMRKDVSSVDRLSPKRALVGGWLLFAAAYGGLALAGRLAVAAALVALVAVAYGLIEPAERALVSRLSPPGRHGNSFGWYTLVQGVMGIPAALLAGRLWNDGPGAPVAFAASAALAAVAAAMLAGCVRAPHLDNEEAVADIGGAPGT